MTQFFKLPVIVAETEFYIDVDKHMSVISTDFVISINDHFLAELTGVRLAIFHYEPEDPEFQYYKVSYRHRKSDMLLPNVVFEIAIMAAIRAHERQNLKPVYYSSIS